jgi:hypothetical protein
MAEAVDVPAGEHLQCLGHDPPLVRPRLDGCPLQACGQQSFAGRLRRREQAGLPKRGDCELHHIRHSFRRINVTTVMAEG